MKIPRAPKVHPIAKVEWVPPGLLRANDYNPNKVFGPEMRLLRQSLIEDGWTQPIVARPDGEIVDGFHRWTLAMTDPDVRALTPQGKVPVVRLRPVDEAHQKMATIRHNRARGQHGILKMAEIVQRIGDLGITVEQLEERLGMDPEEASRLMETRGSPELAGKESFGQGWVPTGKGRRKVLAGRRPKRQKK